MKALKGIRVLVTRAQSQSSVFAQRLCKQGADVSEVPLIKIVPPKSWRSLDLAIKNLERYDWVIFTSVNGAQFFAKRFAKLSKKKFPKIKTCAIGPSTASALKKFNIPVTRRAEKYISESVLDLFKTVRGKNILIVRAKEAREILPQTLKKRGATVSIATAYQTLKNSSVKNNLNALLTQKIDCVTFTSASTVRYFFNVLQNKKMKQNIVAAAIGPITSATLNQFGWTAEIVPAQSTIPALSKAIVNFYKRLSKTSKTKGTRYEKK